MIISIRKFLLVYLLLAIIFMTLLTALGNYYLDQKDIHKHMDFILHQASISFQELLGNDFRSRDLDGLQKHIIMLEKKLAEQTLSLVDGRRFVPKYQFQVWDEKNGKLLLHSSNIPNTRLSKNKKGFSDVMIANEKWRAYATHDDKLGMTLIVAEKSDMRGLLAHRIAIDDFYIMLLTYPIAGILIWLIVGRGLRSIDRVANEVSHRLPNYLEPVEASTVPTEIKPLVVELNKLFFKLQQAFEREKRFAGDAAHELRTPLAALKTQAQVALNTHNDAERSAILKNVIAGVDRCTHVVQQLLTMSRLVPEANVLTDAIPIDIPKLTSEIIAQLVPQAIDKKIEIELIAPDEKHMIMGNVTALSILIRNLVDNAIRYTPENGAINVIVEQNKQHVSLRVIDNGPGIPAELRARVFERFFRVLGSKTPGSGLGLAIVQQIAHLHNAQVKLGPPAMGKGLEVEVIFNRQEADHGS